MIRYPLFIFIFLATKLMGDVAQEEIAGGYVEVGLYDQALSIYEKYLQSTQDPYAQAVIRYNIATTYLRSGDWDDAQKTFNEILTLNNLSPPLRQSLNLNIALVLLHAVENGLNETKTPIQAKQLDQLLEEALRALKISQKAECELQNLQGYSVCSTAPSFQVILKKWSDLKTAVIEKMKQTSKARETLIERLSKKDPQITNIYELLKTINQVVNHPPLQSEQLDKIVIDSELIKEALEKNVDAKNPTVENLITVVLQRMKSSQSAVKDGKQELAVAFLTDAHLLLFKILNTLISLKVNSPEEILGQLLDEQSNVIDLSESFLDLPDDENGGRNQVIKNLPNAQTSVYDKVDQFVKSLYQFQIERFHGTDKNKQCQTEKWTNVINNFDKGYQEALKATQLLRNATPNIKLVLLSQKSSLEYWKKALEELQHDDIPEKSPTNASQTDNNAQKALQLLSEMNTDDKIPTPLPTPTQSVEYPW